MSRDTRLTEALNELEALRASEANARREIEAFASLVEALAMAETPNDTLQTLMSQSVRILEADVILVLEEIDGGLRIRHSHPPLDAQQSTVVPQIEGLTGVSRNLSSLRRSNFAGITSHPAFSEARSMITAPMTFGFGQRGVLIALSREASAFEAEKRKIILRMAQLVSQRLTSIEAQSENQLLSSVLDGAASGVVITDARDPDMPVIYANSAFEHLTGYSNDEIMGMNCRILSDEPSGSPYRARLREWVKLKTSGRVVLRNRRKNGESFWNEISLFPIRDDTGRVRYMAATQMDVSDRVAAQEESRINQNRMDEALAHSTDAFLMLDENHKVILSNARLRELFPSRVHTWKTGSTFSENWADYLSQIPSSMQPVNDQLMSPNFAALAQQPDGSETHLPDGRTILVRARVAGDGSIVFGATDITALKSVEHTLRQRVAAIESAPDGIAVADRNDRIIFANARLAQLFGKSSEINLIGRKWKSMYTNSDARNLMAAMPHRLSAGVKHELQLPYVSKIDGDRVHDLSLSPTSGVGLILVVRDVTEQLAANRRRAELDEQLAQARRQEAIAQLSAGLAHDFNNLLSAINGSAVLISTDDTVTADTRRFAERIVSAGTQAARLVNRLLDLGRVREEDSLFDMRAAVEDGLTLARTNMTTTTQLDFDLGSEPMEIYGNPTEAGQIVINLVLNSHHALNGEKGKITVTLSPHEGGQTDNICVGALKPDTVYARLSVTDTGSGIPPDVLQKIFAPYFSTKGEKGTGIGLASISAIIRRLDGAIAVTSELGKGTKFDIFWPSHNPHAELNVDGSSSPDAVDLSGRLIMVVDDEIEVAEVLGSYLERMGAEVAVVHDPELAIETIQDDPDVWTAVVSDYSMGQMSGGDLVEAVRQSTPDLPIFLLTALARTISDQRINEQTVNGIFAKPANFRQISVELAKLPKANN